MGDADALGGTLDGRSDPSRPTVDGAEAENFIPWRVIEPLLRDGMTASELKAALCWMTGLDSERHIFVSRTYVGDPHAKDFVEALRDGLWVEPRAIVTQPSDVVFISADNRVVRR